ncbi:ATP-binding protein [Catenulispora sp. NL8]|uniref:ATP-binding protein n=1 Tax=Catenulispora pinistramenti TaxID=2705254 RepID=A0ABS5KQ64_9ACTN|nr:ATP-binding protein [Catenulispora pinistramenti]MBS2548175.1 ATP-binding protein [Catenulispora pinistramenti]
MPTTAVHPDALLRSEENPDWLRPALREVCHVAHLVRPGATRGCHLTAHAAAAARARAFTTATLQAWDHRQFVDDVALAVTELFSNALRHGLGVRPAAECHGSIRAVLACLPSAVICLVADPGPGGPAVGEPGPLAECGRGLRVVAALATAWGCVPVRPDGPGKTTWALFTGAGVGHFIKAEDQHVESGAR